MFERTTTADALLVSLTMVTTYTLMNVLHLTVAGVWAGWTVFMAVLVVPAARDGDLDGAALDRLTSGFARFSQIAPLVMLLTGGYMASQGLVADSLLTSLRGQLVVTMVVLWLALSALSNVASRRLATGIESIGVDRSADAVSTTFSAAGVVALALLLVGGWL